MEAGEDVLGDLPATQGEALTSPPGRRRRGRKHTDTGVGAWVPARPGTAPSWPPPFAELSFFPKAVRWLWNPPDRDSTPTSATTIFGALANLLMRHTFPSCVEYLGIQTPTWQR